MLQLLPYRLSLAVFVSTESCLIEAPTIFDVGAGISHESPKRESSSSSFKAVLHMYLMAAV